MQSGTSDLRSVSRGVSTHHGGYRAGHLVQHSAARAGSAGQGSKVATPERFWVLTARPGDGGAGEGVDCVDDGRLQTIGGAGENAQRDFSAAQYHGGGTSRGE